MNEAGYQMKICQNIGSKDLTLTDKLRASPENRISLGKK